MAVEPWPTITIGSVEYWDITGRFRVAKLDPDAQVLFAVSTPDGGIANVGPLVKGDNGKPSLIDTDVNVTELEPDDPTAASATFTEITPGSETVSQVVQLNWTYHKPAAGEDGTTSLDLDSVDGTAAAGKFPALNSGADGLEWQTVKVGDWYYPASIANTPSGNSVYTLCPVSISAQGFDWRPECEGACVVTGGSDVAVDTVARLGSTSGNVVARGMGVAGQTVAHALGPVTPADVTAGGADFDKVSAGDAVTIYYRVERHAGGDFTTSGTSTSFRVKVAPIP